MKARIRSLSFSFCLYAAVASADTPDRLWSRIWGSAGYDPARGAAVDGSGNAYVVGTTDTAFDGETLPGPQGIFLTRHNANGTRAWTRTWGPPQSYATGIGVAVDSTGAVYVVGETWAGMDEEPGIGGIDLYLTKWSPAGDKAWTRVWGSSSTDHAGAVAIDAANNVYAAGHTSGSFDGQTNAGSDDLFVTKFSPDGTRQWSVIYGSSNGTETVFDVAADSSGATYVTGYTGGSLGGQTNSGSQDAFLTRISAAGVPEWSRLWGTSVADQGHGVAADSGGNAYVTGRCMGLNGVPGVGMYDPFLIKVRSDGTSEWTRIWGSTLDDTAADVACDGSGSVYVTGKPGGTFDGVSGGPVYLTRFTTDGTKEWTLRWGGSGTLSRGLDTLGQSAVWVSGQTTSAFDSQPLVGGTDAFLSKLTYPVTTALTNLILHGPAFPYQLSLDTTGEIDRVEFRIGNVVIATVYGPPFTCTVAPSFLGPDAAVLLTSNRIDAVAYAVDGSVAASTTSVWAGLPTGETARVEIQMPYRYFTVYTDTDAAPSNEVTFQALVATWGLAPERFDPRGLPPSADMGPGEFDWRPVTNVEFLIDGELVHVSNSGIPGNPLIHRFEHNVEGLEVGRHIFVARVQPEGYRRSADSRGFFVERRRPDIAFLRSVRANTSHFDVELRLRNDGSGPAELVTASERMSGFQACRVETTWSNATSEVNFLPEADACEVSVRFAPSNSLAAGDEVVLRYKAVPFMTRGDCAYTFGGADATYSCAVASNVTESQTVLTECSGEAWDPVPLDDAVRASFATSDYLIVTSPLNLAARCTSNGADRVLTASANLATLRNAVLGYYNGCGVVKTPYRAGDPVAVAQMFDDWNLRGQVFVGDVNEDRIRCYNEAREIVIEDSDDLPIHADLRDGDRMAAGAIEMEFETGTNLHLREEIAVALGSGHPEDERGRARVYQFARGGDRVFTVSQPPVGYDDGDGFAVGEIFVHPEAAYAADEIVVANTDGAVYAYSYRGEPRISFATTYSAGDGFALGDLFGDVNEEAIVADVASDRLNIYGRPAHADAYAHDYGARLSIAESLAPEDGLAAGDVLGDARAEILLADDSLDQLRIYTYDAAAGAMRAAAELDVDFAAGDTLLCGPISSTGKSQPLIARGSTFNGHVRGTVEVLNVADGRTPGSRGDLDALLDAHGEWTSRMGSDFARSGHLLLVGETEIVPTFSANWDLYCESLGRVDYTDRNYASTDSPSDQNLPELAMGRMPGNSADDLCAGLRSAIELAEDPSRLQADGAFVVTGLNRGASGVADDIDFSVLGRDIRQRLTDAGFGVQYFHSPDNLVFFHWANARDLIFLAGHGWWSSWNGIGTYDVGTSFDPPRIRPVIFAAACLTGRYPEGYGLAEAFLTHGASVFVGATETTIGSVVWGWGPRMGQAFTRCVLDPENTTGRALRAAKRDRLDASTWAYWWDGNYSRYHAAITHLLGDPKAALLWPEAEGAAGLRKLSSAPLRPGALTGPLDEVGLTVPHFEVLNTNGFDMVTIPGHADLVVPGMPMVPVCDQSVRFPAGCHVQTVTLSGRGTPESGSGLVLPVAVPLVMGAHGGIGTFQGEAWWPEVEFDWEVRKDADGAEILSVRAFPFYYNTNTTEFLFYTNYLFNVAYAWSDARIYKIGIEKTEYTPGEIVRADVYLWNTNAAPVTARLEGEILRNEAEVVEALASRTLSGLATWGTSRIEWDSTGAEPGDYILRLRLEDAQGTVLDRRQVCFELGGTASGRIVGFEMTPHGFRLGEDVLLAATFQNTGSAALDGTIVIAVQNAAGLGMAEFRCDFTSLGAGASRTFETNWAGVTLVPRDCRIVVYGLYGGGTSGLTVGADWTEAPLLWDAIEGAPAGCVLRWPSVAGRLYAVDYTTDLVGGTFSNLAAGLPATPPQNVHTDAAPRTSGFYRVWEQW